MLDNVSPLCRPDKIPYHPIVDSWGVASVCAETDKETEKKDQYCIALANFVQDTYLELAAYVAG
jgi:hypothetical protein